jgi:hypothetical protein
MKEDILKTKLDKLAEGLNQKERETEAALRKQWTAAQTQLKASRYEMGEALAGYKELYKAEKKWLTVLKTIGVARRTADDYIARYTAASKIPTKLRLEAERQNVDLGKPAVLALVNVAAWERLKDASAETIEKEVAKIKQASKRPAQTTAAAKTDNDRLKQLQQLAEKLYGNVDPNLRAEELPRILKRLTEDLLKHYSVEAKQEAAAKKEAA